MRAPQTPGTKPPLNTVTLMRRLQHSTFLGQINSQAIAYVHLFRHSCRLVFWEAFCSSPGQSSSPHLCSYSTLNILLSAFSHYILMTCVYITLSSNVNTFLFDSSGSVNIPPPYQGLFLSSVCEAGQSPSCY